MSVVRVHTDKGTYDYPNSRYSRTPDGGLSIVDEGPEALDRAFHAPGTYTHASHLYEGEEEEAHRAHAQRQEKALSGHAEEPKQEAARKA